jgi:hypothetical protein
LLNFLVFLCNLKARWLLTAAVGECCKKLLLLLLLLLLLKIKRKFRPITGHEDPERE